MPDFTSVIHQLEHERSRLNAQLGRLDSAISVLNGVGENRSGRTVSAAGRARIAAAQRARWAKTKGGKVVVISAAKKTMSPATRRKIAAAQKARWKKWRASREH